MSTILPSPLPDASATQRGAVSTGTQTIAGAKTFSSALTVNGVVESTTGGFKLPDDTIIASAGDLGGGGLTEPLTLTQVLTSSVATGGNALTLSNNGARIKWGAGAAEFISMDATNGGTLSVGAGSGHFSAYSVTSGNGGILDSGGILSHGTIESDIASGSNAFKMAQGARLVTNGATATRYLSDNGSQMAVTGSVAFANEISLVSTTGMIRFDGPSGTPIIRYNGGYLEVGGVTVKMTSNVDASAYQALASGTVTLAGRIADGASAIGAKVVNYTDLATAGAKVMQWYRDNATTALGSINQAGTWKSEAASGANAFSCAQGARVHFGGTYLSENGSSQIEASAAVKVPSGGVVFSDGSSITTAPHAPPTIINFQGTAETTTSSSFATLTSGSFTQAVANQEITVLLRGSALTATNGATIMRVRVSYDGSAKTDYPVYLHNTSEHTPFSYFWRFTGSASAGSKTVLVEWSRSSGTGTVSVNANHIWQVLVY